ncbi:hypothetical protein C8R43DRAFT_1142160 [Mycena crocata]|nr:hypothetical protein C8R43DRAFT_1142160 [Mycena crocata]
MAVQDLPVELLIKIFKLTKASRDEAMDFGKISLNHGPWGLARVCGRWRSTVLDMPYMWSEIFISIPASTPSWINYPVGLLTEQLERAAEHPLHVALISEEVPVYTTAKIFAAIVESCSRWETLDLFSKWTLPADDLLVMCDRIPLLREINVCADSTAGYVGRNVFRFAPSLRVVRITEPRLHADNRNMDPHHPSYNPDYNDSFVWPSAPADFLTVFPWAQLTHYESQCTHPSHFDALCLAQNLTVCQLTIVLERRNRAWRPPTRPVCFPQLQKLALFAPAALLDRLVLPALQDFFVEVFPCDFPHVVALLQRSSCSLRKFWMKSHPPEPQYRAILERNPNIVELGIIGREELRMYGACPNIDNIIASLRVPQDGSTTTTSVLLPQLRAFYIHDQAADLDLSAVVRMIDGRMRSERCARLEKVCVTEWDRRVIPAGIKGRLLKQKNDGLDVQFRTEPYRWVGRGLLEYL